MALRRNLLIVTLVVAQHSHFHILADHCYPNKADFDALCTSKFEGVTDGGRCFFISMVKATSWASAWTVCKSYHNASLAQFHTESEYGKVAAFVTSLYPKYNGSSNQPLAMILMAYFDTTLVHASDRSQCESLGQAHWYNSETTFIAGLNRANTLAKYYDCRDCCSMNTAPRCYSMQYYDDGCEQGFSGMNFWYPACMLSNEIQSYSRSGNCLTEAVIASTPGATANECANECSARSAWCRSYNSMYYGEGNGSNRCDMFSRSVLDCGKDPAKCPMKISETSDCIHYNYIP